MVEWRKWILKLKRGRDPRGVWMYVRDIIRHNMSKVVAQIENDVVLGR